MHSEKKGDMVLIPYDVALETRECVRLGKGLIVRLRSCCGDAKIHIVRYIEYLRYQC